MSSRRAAVGSRRGEPPGPELFAGAEARQTLGSRAATLDLPGLPIGLTGMDDASHAAFLARYAPYAVDAATGAPTPALVLRASRARVQSFIEPPPPGVAEVNPVWTRVEQDTSGAGHFHIRLCTYHLAASFGTAGGIGHALFSAGEPLRGENPVENLLRVTLAWLAITRGGILMHSASIVRDERAFLFFGLSGAGKSTLSASSRKGRVVSDDLSLLLPGDGRMEVVGSPFRGTYSGGAPVTGRFAVAAAFSLSKSGAGEPDAVQPLPRSRAMAEAVANLPFVVDQLHVSPSLLEGAERALGSFPILGLRFRKGDTFWEAIERANL